MQKGVHILDLVSQLVKIVGYKTIENHVENLINYLPALWTELPKIDNETGGEVRFQKSLVTLTSNIIQAIGATALENPRVGELSLSLLQYTTNPDGQQALNMLDEGIQLWMSIVQASNFLSPVLLEFYPRLFRILQPDHEPLKVLPILEAYILLSPASVNTVKNQLLICLDQLIGRSQSKESTLTANVVETLIRVFPNEAPSWLLDPTLHRLTRDLVEGEALDRRDTEKKKLTPSESLAFAIILSRIVVKEPNAFSALCGGIPHIQERLLDRWLQCLSVRSIDEVFSTFASINGLHQRKIISLALLRLLESSHPVAHENSMKVMRLVQTVVSENKKLAPRIKRFRELESKSQLNRKLETLHLELRLNDPIDALDFEGIFQHCLSKYPLLPEEDISQALELQDHLPIFGMEHMLP